MPKDLEGFVDLHGVSDVERDHAQRLARLRRHRVRPGEVSLVGRPGGIEVVEGAAGDSGRNRQGDGQPPEATGRRTLARGGGHDSIPHAL